MSAPGLRRNGKRPSCEPCRKSKLSCDHVTPICGRCLRRKIPDRCQYHPNPMTGLKQRHRRNDSEATLHTSTCSPGLSSGSELTRSSNSISTSSPNLNGQSVLSTSSGGHLETSTSERSQNWPDGLNRARSGRGPYSGFLGSTSFSAVFDENETQIGFSADVVVDEQIECLSTREHERKIKEGAAVLTQLVDVSSYERLINRWLEFSRDLALISPFIKACIDSVKTELIDKYLAAPGDRAILAASELLLDNSVKPFRVLPTCTIAQFPLLFTGSNIRWETLACVFVCCGLSVLLAGPHDPAVQFIGPHSSDRQNFVHRMVEASSTCLSFCTDAGHLNDFGLWVLHEHCILVSQVLGDAHYYTWRRLGDLSTAMFAMGLHQEIKESPDVPFWLTEFRKKSLGIIYGIDKMIAVFVGRPPRISKRYCSIEIPLDLEFEEFGAEGQELKENLAKIGVDGWNKDGLLRRASHTRAFIISNLVREDILELSLGRNTDGISAAATEIARRNKADWDSFPQRMKYYPEIWSSDRSSEDNVVCVIVYMDIVYNEFLLQRTLVRKIRAQSDELVRISRLLLTTVLTAVNNRGQFGSVDCDSSWVVVLYGLPPAGVLALELLQQTQQRAHLIKDFPRSEVIQNLSVFVSCLGWIHNEGDGNYLLCIQARNMIQRILDRVLSPDSLVSSQNIVPTPSNSDFTSEAMYDFSWMDNAQFDADFWSNLDFHPLLAIPDS